MKAQIPPPNVVFDKEELRGRLTPVEFQVTQEKHTERPYSNKFYKHREKGTYNCKVCGRVLFLSKTKYEAGTGWPSFYDVSDKEAVVYRPDASGVGGNLLLIVSRPDLIRTEVTCRNCGSHLGHVFNDGPKPTGQRYCVNSSSLDFVADSAILNLSDEPDSSFPSTTRPEVVEEEVISFPATLGGCDGPGGSCSLRARKEVQKRLQEMTISTPANVEKKTSDEFGNNSGPESTNSEASSG